MHRVLRGIGDGKGGEEEGEGDVSFQRSLKGRSHGEVRLDGELGSSEASMHCSEEQEL